MIKSTITLNGNKHTLTLNGECVSLVNQHGISVHLSSVMVVSRESNLGYAAQSDALIAAVIGSKTGTELARRLRQVTRITAWVAN